MNPIHQFAAALIEHLAGVIGALLGDTVEVQDAAGQPERRQWVVEVAVDGAQSGVIRVAIGQSAAAALTAVITGIDGDVPPASISDALKEMLGQAISADTAGLDDARLQLTTTGAALRDGDPAGTLVASHSLAGTSLKAPIGISVYVDLSPVARVEAAGAAAENPDGATASRIDVILDIDLPVTVRFGHTDMAIRALTRLGPGSVIDLGRSPDDPVEVLVSGRVVARGEVVIVGGNYGVRIADVVTPSERMRSLEA